MYDVKYVCRFIHSQQRSVNSQFIHNEVFYTQIDTPGSIGEVPKSLFQRL